MHEHGELKQNADPMFDDEAVRSMLAESLKEQGLTADDITPGMVAEFKAELQAVEGSFDEPSNSGEKEVTPSSEQRRKNRRTRPERKTLPGATIDPIPRRRNSKKALKLALGGIVILLLASIGVMASIILDDTPEDDLDSLTVPLQTKNTVAAIEPPVQQQSRPARKPRQRKPGASRKDPVIHLTFDDSANHLADSSGFMKKAEGQSISNASGIRGKAAGFKAVR